MTLEEIKKYFVSGYKFSMITGMAHTNFTNWKKKGYIPILAQHRIEQLTGGELKADFKHAEKQYNVD